VLADVTPGVGKAVGEDAAFEIAAEATLDIRRRRLAERTAGEFQPGGEVRLDGAIPQRLLGTAALITLGVRCGARCGGSHEAWSGRVSGVNYC